MRAIPREREKLSLLVWECFYSQAWPTSLSVKSAFFLNVVLFVFYCCHLLLLLWVSKRPFITSNICKEAINIRSRLQSFKKTWLLDSTVNWDSHQTELRKLSTVLEKGKVLSQRCYQTKHNFVSTNPFHRTTARKNGTLMERGVQTQS